MDLNTYNVYDFDGTIYAGDSSIDFLLFSLRRHPRALLRIPAFMLSVYLYGLKKCSKETLKESFFSFLRYLPDVEQEVELFWQSHREKMYSWYIEKTHHADVIISASPDFLLKPFLQKYGVHSVIATVVDPKTGTLLSANCRGEEKVLRYRESFGHAPIAEAYFDSSSDHAIAQLANQAFRVRKDGSLCPVSREELV